MSVIFSLIHKNVVTVCGSHTLLALGGIVSTVVRYVVTVAGSSGLLLEPAGLEASVETVVVINLINVMVAGHMS